MNLSELPELPPSLERLVCVGNRLTHIPSLPPSLKWLSCSYNQLTELPPLPEGLEALTCSQNKITSLPILPKNMVRLICHDNSLTALPTLPPSLRLLGCGENRLSYIPNLPYGLTELWCDDNPWNATFRDYMIHEDRISRIQLHYVYARQRSRDTFSVYQVDKGSDNFILNADVMTVVSSFISGEEGEISTQLSSLRKSLY